MSAWIFFLLGPAGALGALVRFGLDRAITARWEHPGLGIVCVNIVACALMGAAAALMVSGATWSLFATGFLGGLSTFSTAVLDVAVNWRARPAKACALLAGGLVLCLCSFAVGMSLATQFAA